MRGHGKQFAIDLAKALIVPTLVCVIGLVFWMSQQPKPDPLIYYDGIPDYEIDPLEGVDGNIPRQQTPRFDPSKQPTGPDGEYNPNWREPRKVGK